MLYIIDNKCYVNVAPLIYVEVVVSKDGSVTPTDNKIEVNANTSVTRTTLEDWLNNFVENEPEHNRYVPDKKYNKRKR